MWFVPYPIWPPWIAEDKDLDDYQPADIAMALCRMVSYNIGQLAYLNAKRYGYLKPQDTSACMSPAFSVLSSLQTPVEV